MTTAKTSKPSFQVQLTKKQANQIIQYYLDNYQKNGSIQYDFYLKNQALLKGKWKILGTSLDFYLYFDPYLMENGNVKLQARKLSVGSLSLPIKELLSYVKSQGSLPDWIEVNPADKNILLNLNKYKLKNGMTIKADKMDLVNDNIRFNVYIPTN